MDNFQKFLNIFFIYIICLILLASYAYQFILNETPCSLCMLQRVGMIGIASSLLLNLRFGIKIQYYGLAIICALLGRIVALRQIGLHICPDFPAFGRPIFGIDLYVWSFIIFSASIFACAVLLILKGFSNTESYPPRWGFFEYLGFWTLLVIIISNGIITFADCGFSLCIP